jgi:RNA polymerase sigma factor (sigma-70 family)
MSDPTDGQLWARVVEGEPEALGDLFVRHARAIYNFCFRRTADWGLAEDLTSTVFLEAWRRRAEVVMTGQSLLPWLYGVATNLLRNQSRSMRRGDAARARLQMPTEGPDFADDVAARLDDQERMRRILQVVHALPLADQEVLALCAWQGLSYQEAATAVDLPVGTIRSRLSRARARLRELLEPNEHEQGERRSVGPAQGERPTHG